MRKLVHSTSFLQRFGSCSMSFHIGHASSPPGRVTSLESLRGANQGIESKLLATWADRRKAFG
jgi:hypothetical protein